MNEMSELKQRGKNVRFSSNPSSVVLIQRIADKDRSKIWLNYDDLKSIQRQIQSTVKAIANYSSNCLDADVYCTRGLESRMSRKIYLARKERRRSIIATILDQQRLYREKQEENYIGISRTSRILSRKHVSKALQLAQQDARVAERIHEEDSQTAVSSVQQQQQQDSCSHDRLCSLLSCALEVVSSDIASVPRSAEALPTPNFRRFTPAFSPIAENTQEELPGSARAYAEACLGFHLLNTTAPTNQTYTKLSKHISTNLPVNHDETAALLA